MFLKLNVILMSCTVSLFAQNTSIHFTHLNVEDGLSQSSVFAILQDKDGFMWFGTEDGLNRYDGYNFRVFKTNISDKNSLPNNMVTALLQDGEGFIWVGTSEGLCRYNPQTEKIIRYNFIEALDGSYINAIFENNQNELFIATRLKGLIRLETASNSFTSFTKIDTMGRSRENKFTNSINAIIQVDDSTYYFSTPDGLVRLNAQTNHFKRFSFDGANPNFYAKSVILEKTRLLLGTDKSGLLAFDLRTMEFYDPLEETAGMLPISKIMDVRKMSKNKIWIATQFDGLAVWDKKYNKIEHLRFGADPASLSGDFIESLFEDRAGMIWVGTNASGINIYDPKRKKFKHIFHNPGNANSLTDNMVYMLMADKNILWVGTDKRGLDRLNLKTGQVKNFNHNPSHKKSIPGNSVRAMFKDSFGKYWVGVANGSIASFDPDKEIFENIDPENKYNFAVRTIGQDSLYKEEYLWIGTINNGLVRYNRIDKTFKTYVPGQGPKSINSHDIRAFYTDKKGNIWLGTFDGGLNRFDPRSETFEHFSHNPEDLSSISNNLISSIQEARHGPEQVLWVGSANGLNRFDVDARKFKRYFVEDGLPNNVIYTIQIDQNDNIWVATNNGISRLDPQKNTFRNFRLEDGLQNLEFNIGASSQNAQGEIFMGGISGLNIFHPDSIEYSNFKHPVKITRFQIFDKDVTLPINISQTKNITLDYDQDFFSFEFASLSLSAPEKNQYAYKMQGFDKEWVYCGTRRYVSYTNLDPGDYIFMVRGTNSDGVWNEEGTSINIHINAPPWLTWWAFLIYFTAFVLIGFGLRWVVLNWKSLIAIRKRNISHYKLMERVGEGGMGSVYRAVDVNTNEVVALKVLKPEMLKDESNKKRFRHEGHLLTSLFNKHIVETYEIGEVGNLGFIAMEFLTGGTLEEYLEQNQPMPLDEIKHIALQICDGLNEIHSKNIYHRDIKAGNIMLDEAKNIRIMDFGLSKSPLVSTMTNLGTAMGTLGYVAPEQVTGINVDHRTDIFSLGVLIYFMLTNKRPFSGENEMTMIHSIFNTVPSAPSSIRKGVPELVDKIVGKCMDKDPINRYGSAKELGTDLEKIAP
jgi:ligand-binding sensor domain-containing protein/tRNA A-37 threonylcarbamoyl transferase component Bud32